MKNIKISDFKRGDIVSIVEKDYSNTLEYEGTINTIFETEKYLRISGKDVPSDFRDVHISNILEINIIGNAYENMKIKNI